MSDASAADERTQRFAEAVRSFAGAPPKRFAKLLPHREGIAELRLKGASFGMIRELLATVGVHVAADTVRRFHRDVIEEPRTGHKRSNKRPPSAAPASLLTEPTNPSPVAEPPRSRGPRVADPRNL